MKRVILLLTVLLAIGFAYAVPREIVIVEAATGTWCVYCPGVALACEDMIENNLSVGIVKYHGGDSYETPESSARISYYNVTGYPTTVFDGTSSHTGGNASSSIYNTLLPYYNSAIAVDSPISMEFDGELTGNNVNIDVTVTKEQDFDTNTPVLHFAVTESHIQESWFIMDEVNFCMRDMIPDQNGTALDFSTNTTITQNYNFTINGAWNPANCEIVAWVQNAGTKEIYQGKKIHFMEMSDFPPPNGLTADLDGTQVYLAWNAPSRDLDGYNIYRNNTLLQYVTTTEFTDDTVIAGNAYTYYVTGVYSNPDGESVGSNTVEVVIAGAVDEGFENGFSDYPWVMGGTADWLISTQAHSGSSSAQSGDITHNQESSIEVTMTTTGDGMVSFYRRVSSESNYDYLRFYVDGNMMEEWSGTLDWEMFGYQVPAGTHTFKWAYEKDFSVDSGSDCAWIDDISFPPTGEVQEYMVTANVSLDDGNPAEGALVTLTNQTSGQEYDGTVPASGTLVFDAVAAGSYDVEASLDGYETYTGDVVVNSDQTIDIQLVPMPLDPVENLEWDYNSDTGVVDLTWEAPGGGGGEESFFSGFEGNDLSDWGEFIQGPGTPGETGNAYWYIDNAPMTPYQGQCVRADWGYNIDTWLITPEINITADTEISFAWFSSYYWSVDPNDNSDLFVQVSTDGGESWAYIWTYGEIGVWENFTWYETVLHDELEPYVGYPVLIAWNLNGNDNSENALDECYVGPATGREAGTHAMHQSQWAGDIARVSPQTTPQAPVVTTTRELLGYKIVVDNSNDGETILEELWADTSYSDNPAYGENTYTVYAVYDEGESEGVSTDPINVVSTGEGDTPGYVTNLGDNYPNPFNPETTIGFSLSQSENVVIDIYNLRGQKVRSLVNQSMTAGEHQVVWNGTDNNGKTVPSGMYLFKMKAGRYTSTKKMILLK